jgi:hypothetical protein
MRLNRFALLSARPTTKQPSDESTKTQILKLRVDSYNQAYLKSTNAPDSPEIFIKRELLRAELVRAEQDLRDQVDEERTILKHI